MKYHSILLSSLPWAAAWPAVMEATMSKRSPVYPTVPKPLFLSHRGNCGAHGNCTTFNADDQFVDVREGSGHEWQAPGPNDLRGECPGLNAAANHGFAPRSGIWTIDQTITGLAAAYSMSTDLALVLAILSIALDGDPIAGTWSIGGGYKGSLGLLGQPTGIVGTHNRYEGDASVTRGDAYLHGGNVGVFELHKWEHLVSLFGEDDNLTQDRMAAHAWYTMEYSVLNNPYAFWNGFSGLVAPDAHNFVVNFMSNHSAENPGGSLSLETLKSFWSVTGGPGNWVHTPGNERIPDNWYKRPTIDSMDTVDTNVDTLISDGMYPGIVKLGGNTGTTNSFAGVDTGDLTGGVYNAQNLLQGDKLSCFMLQFAMTGLLDFAYPLLEPVGELQSYLASNLGPEFQSLNCPQLAEFNNELFTKYPGASYKAQGE